MVRIADNSTRMKVGAVQFVAHPSGPAIEITRNFPASDLDLYAGCRLGPYHIRTAHDFDGDTVADHVCSTPVRFVDVDGDGVIRRDSGDLMLLAVSDAKVIQPGVALSVGASERVAVARRVVDMLGGAGVR